MTAAWFMVLGILLWSTSWNLNAWRDEIKEPYLHTMIALMIHVIVLVIAWSMLLSAIPF